MAHIFCKVYTFYISAKNLFTELRHGFYIISGKKSFAVYAATATEKSEWMAHIQKCVADLIAKGTIHIRTIRKPMDISSLSNNRSLHTSLCKDNFRIDVKTIRVN